MALITSSILINTHTLPSEVPSGVTTALVIDFRGTVPGRFWYTLVGGVGSLGFALEARDTLGLPVACMISF